jgi:hypothetical protein
MTPKHGEVRMTPKHGEVRHHGLRRVDGKETTYEDKQGRLVYRGPTLPVVESVTETYCTHCKTWVQTNGIMGPLKYMAEHRDGDCVKAKP